MSDEVPGSISNRRARWVRIALWIGFLAFLGLTGFLIFHEFDQQRQIEQAAFVIAQQQAAIATSQIHDVFSGVQNIADAIADDLSTGKLSYQDIDARMQAELMALPSLDGIA